MNSALPNRVRAPPALAATNLHKGFVRHYTRQATSNTPHPPRNPQCTTPSTEHPRTAFIAQILSHEFSAHHTRIQPTCPPRKTTHPHAPRNIPYITVSSQRATVVTPRPKRCMPQGSHSHAEAPASRIFLHFGGARDPFKTFLKALKTSHCTSLCVSW